MPYFFFERGRGKQSQRNPLGEQSSYDRPEGLGGNRPQARRGNLHSAGGAGPFCPGRFYLSKKLKTTVHFRHSPGTGIYSSQCLSFLTEPTFDIEHLWCL